LQLSSPTNETISVVVFLSRFEIIIASFGVYMDTILSISSYVLVRVCMAPVYSRAL